MKKIIAVLLALCLTLAFAGCAKTEPAPETTVAPTVPETTAAPETEPATEATQAPAVTGMTHEEYIAADMDSEVDIVTYVQGHQSWWDNKITVYAQSPDGAYFLYEMACSEEDAAKLVPGTKIHVTGYKGEWAGEVEIMDATFEFVDDGDTWIAPATDVTHLLGTDELIAHQNEFVSFHGLTVENISYKNDAPTDDIYVTLGYNGASYDFCVEAYLTGPDTEVYTTVGELEVGDVVHVQGYLYWYQGVNTHITAVYPASGTTHEEYIAAELDSEVDIVTYVQNHQSWWDSKVTVYAQSHDGAYFLYEMACTEEDAAKLVPGTKIHVTGYKTEWEGEVEVAEATFEFVNDGDTYIAPATDVTALLGTDELIDHQNKLVSFQGLTIEKISYKNDEPGDDIYVTVGYNGASYDFCVEAYLTGADTEVYATVGTLSEGDTVNVEGFLYWYQGVNTHITSVTKVG